MAISILFFALLNVLTLNAGQEETMKHEMKKENNTSLKNEVFKKVLDNGLTVLVRPLKTIPKVSIQMWYNVGSRDEETHQKGIAHLIEHMVFKGTSGKDSLNLSESDINILMHKLSGSCNAFTSYDYTGYLFNLPTHHWKSILPVIADCMQHCSFKEELLNSELKAVIQELKMYKDEYVHALIDDMLAMIFTDHPYHDPIIGYKHNLWSLHSNDLLEFYKTYYLPNNATFVVVGDVDPDDVFKTAQKYFGSIPADKSCVRSKLHHTPDIASKKLVLYRDIQQPLAALFFVIPGSIDKKDQYVEVISWILGTGKGSRLHRALVDELQLVTAFQPFHIDLFEHGMFGFAFEPKNSADIPKIKEIIAAAIADLIDNGFKKGELERAVKNAQVHLYDTFENMQQQAYDIGKYYLATGDPNYLFNYLNEPIETIGKKVNDLLREYLRTSVMHEGMVEPLPANEKAHWAQLQEKSDREDQEILAARGREAPVEPPHYAKKVNNGQMAQFQYPQASKKMLDNGLTVYYYPNAQTPKINIIIDLKGKQYYDPEEKQGLSNFMNRLLLEGTEHYSALQLTDELESRGIHLVTLPGEISMSMLNADFNKGLELLYEVLTKATFDPDHIEKVREQILADIKSFWDEPTMFSSQLVKGAIYKGHPFSKNVLGTEESVRSITRDDIVNYYHKYITPDKANIAIVGDIDSFDVPAVVEQYLGKWEGPAVEDLKFPRLKQPDQCVIPYTLNRDQVVLCLAGLSVARKDPDFDKLLLFDQIFGSGVLGSMASRLFQLREETGLFYTINGSVIANASEQPGLVLVKTIVSLDRLKEARNRLDDLIDHVADSIAPHEVEQAKLAVLNALVNNFETNAGIAHSFLFLARYGMPQDYYDKRASLLMPITVAQIQEAANKVLNIKKLVTVEIGRVA